MKYLGTITGMWMLITILASGPFAAQASALGAAWLAFILDVVELKKE